MTENFFESVYLITALIPRGRVTTYGAIGNYLGLRNSARMVGWALNKCYSANYQIPAHRVVNRNGQLTGKRYFGGLNVMQQLLEQEGAIIENDRIVNFNEMFWDPQKELK
jgi:methylated-DNA-protein-cysteine methyltransferase-like protein